MKKRPGPKISKDGKKIRICITLHRSAIQILRNIAVKENISASSWIEKTILKEFESREEKQL